MFDVKPTFTNETQENARSYIFTSRPVDLGENEAKSLRMKMIEDDFHDEAENESSEIDAFHYQPVNYKKEKQRDL